MAETVQFEQPCPGCSGTLILGAGSEIYLFRDGPQFNYIFSPPCDDCSRRVMVFGAADWIVQLMGVGIEPKWEDTAGRWVQAECFEATFAAQLSQVELSPLLLEHQYWGGSPSVVT